MSSIAGRRRAEAMFAFSNFNKTFALIIEILRDGCTQSVGICIFAYFSVFALIISQPQSIIDAFTLSKTRDSVQFSLMILFYAFISFNRSGAIHSDLVFMPNKKVCTVNKRNFFERRERRLVWRIFLKNAPRIETDTEINNIQAKVVFFYQIVCCI